MSDCTASRTEKAELPSYQGPVTPHGSTHQQTSSVDVHMMKITPDVDAVVAEQRQQHIFDPEHLAQQVQHVLHIGVRLCRPCS